MENITGSGGEHEAGDWLKWQVDPGGDSSDESDDFQQ